MHSCMWCSFVVEYLPFRLQSFTNWRGKTNETDGPLTCLLRAFEQMTFQSCLDYKSFGIDFQNLAFEVFVPRKNESRFDLFAKRLIVDRTDIIRENFRANLPMMMIERKISHRSNQSIILVEQENDLNSLQTANVTITFDHRVSSSEVARQQQACLRRRSNHRDKRLDERKCFHEFCFQSSELRYQCRAYHSTNFSLNLKYNSFSPFHLLLIIHFV